MNTQIIITITTKTEVVNGENYKMADYSFCGCLVNSGFGKLSSSKNLVRCE